MKTVQITILARDKEKELPMFLQCIDNVDYDKKSIRIYAHTNNNTDRTAEILKEWCDKNEQNFLKVTFIEEDIPELRDNPARKCESDWYANGGIRLQELGKIRQMSLMNALFEGSEYYFVCDVDNFFPPETIKYCVEQDRPIISPMMVDQGGALPRSFYHKCSSNGYYKENPVEKLIWSHFLKGVFEVELVHLCYMVKTGYVKRGLSYLTDGVRMEFVTFAESARLNGVTQFTTNEIQTLFDPTLDDYDHNVKMCRHMSYMYPYGFDINERNS